MAFNLESQRDVWSALGEEGGLAPALWSELFAMHHRSLALQLET
jgi:hypothetical protein